MELWSPAVFDLWRGSGLARDPVKKWIRLTSASRQAKFFWPGPRFAAFAILQLGVFLVGVVEQLAASPATRPANAGVTAARLPIDATRRGQRFALGTGLLFALPAAGVLVHFLLPLAYGAPGLLCESGL
jgi:hypothetical protein